MNTSNTLNSFNDYSCNISFVKLLFHSLNIIPRKDMDIRPLIIWSNDFGVVKQKFVIGK